MQQAVTVVHAANTASGGNTKTAATTDVDEDSTSSSGDIAVGIDLGTTYSAVAVYERGTVNVIANEQGNRITPSWVAMAADGERLVGDAAKNQAATNPQNTVYDAKRLIGRPFDDKQVQEDVAHFPFRVEQGSDGGPVVSLSRGSRGLRLTPTEISAMVLERMKATAEAYLGKNVTQAVVTVPAYFNDQQRQATKDAGRIAGLKVLRVLNEPTAAAIAFGLDERLRRKTVLVFDLGGGTFDVSLLTIDRGDFRVRATNGNTHLGGADFDQRIMDHLVRRFKLKHERDLTSVPRAMAKLRREAERAKRALSSREQVLIELPSLMDGIDMREKLTRARFEEMCKDLFRQTVEPIQKVLKDADVYPREVDHIVLVGGSTRIPYIRKMVAAMFKDKDPATGVNPDEAVAYGAAVQAAVLSGARMAHNVALHDVTPLSLGIKTAGGMMSVLIPRNTPTPAAKERTFSTHRDGQTMVTVNVYEGERTLVKHCHFLGKFDLKGIEPAPRGARKIRVAFNIDADGILAVEAYVVGRGSEAQTLTIDADSRRLSEDELKQMLRAAEDNREEDRRVKHSREARNRLEQQAVSLRLMTSDPEVEALDLSEIETQLELLYDALNACETVLEGAKPGEEATFFNDERAKLTAVAQPVTDYIRDALATAAQESEDEGEGEGGGEGDGEEEADKDEQNHDEF